MGDIGFWCDMDPGLRAQIGLKACGLEKRATPAELKRIDMGAAIIAWIFGGKVSP